MKKIICILLAAVFLLNFSGCNTQTAGPPTSPPPKNDLFTDAFFTDVVQIGFFSIYEPVAGAQMEPVIQYLKGLSLKENDFYLSGTTPEGEWLDGLGDLTFLKSDGTKISFLMNHATLSHTEIGCYSVTDNENLNRGLNEAFQQGHSIETTPSN